MYVTSYILNTSEIRITHTSPALLCFVYRYRLISTRAGAGAEAEAESVIH